MGRFEIDFLTEYDEKSLLEELRRIASKTGSNSMTKADINRIGRFNYSVLIDRFGSLRHALQLASLEVQRFTKSTEVELLAFIVELWQQVLEKEGRTPQRRDLKAYGFPISGDTIVRRFGSWRKALIRANASVTEQNVTEDQSIIKKSSTRQRQGLSIRKRFFVFKRDHFACVRCGASGVGTRLEVHHRVPFAKGGSDNFSNLETLCYECNRGQSDSVV